MVRPYDHGTDADALWSLKRAFERELGGSTGGDEKAKRYESKLTEDYRQRYLEWVGRCVDEEPKTVQLVERDGSAVGYVFVLPQSLSMIWDAAVLNEVYVRESYRGTGAADDLMEAAIEYAQSQELPLPRLVLDVDTDNERAQGLYDRYGFEHWGEMVARDL